MPRVEVAVAVIVSGLQEVGLRVKLGRVEVHRNRADVERDAVEDLGEGIGDGAPLGADRVDVERGPDHDGAEVKGAGDRRGDDHHAERGGFVGAGEVGVAGGVEGVGPAPAPTLTRAELEAAGQLGLCCSRMPSSGWLLAWAAAIWASVQ